MKKLFISYTKLLYAMVRGGVTPEDLNTSLFFFECARDHVLSQDPSDVVAWIARRIGQERAKEIQALIASAFLKAEDEGRALSRKWPERNTYAALNALLMANGFAVLPGIVEGINDDGYYSYSGVDRRVKEIALELEVVF